MFKHCDPLPANARREIVPQIASKLRRLIEEAKEVAREASEKRPYERVDAGQLAG